MSSHIPTEKRVTILEIVSRANSSFRYWNYRRKAPERVPLSIRWAIAEWFRRFAFEWRNNR